LDPCDSKGDSVDPFWAKLMQQVTGVDISNRFEALSLFGQSENQPAVLSQRWQRKILNSILETWFSNLFDHINDWGYVGSIQCNITLRVFIDVPLPDEIIVGDLFWPLGVCPKNGECLVLPRTSQKVTLRRYAGPCVFLYVDIQIIQQDLDDYLFFMQVHA